MKFHGKAKIIAMCLCILCIISTGLVALRVLPFIIFLITILVSFGIECYILIKWLRWKKDIDESNKG
jgi:hypothetical protein